MTEGMKSVYKRISINLPSNRQGTLNEFYKSLERIDSYVPHQFISPLKGQFIPQLKHVKQQVDPIVI